MPALVYDVVESFFFKTSIYLENILLFPSVFAHEEDDS